MAEGIRKKAGSTWGLSITGIAGPSGGTLQKPVGLVFIGVSSVKGTCVRKFLFRGDRGAIRERTVAAALDLLRTSC